MQSLYWERAGITWPAVRGRGCVGGGGIKLPIAVTGMSLGRIGCCPAAIRSAARLTPPSLGPAASSKPLLRNSLSNLEGLLLAAAAAEEEVAEVDFTTGTGSFRTPLPASRTVSRFAPAARGSSPLGEKIGLKICSQFYWLQSIIHTKCSKTCPTWILS